MALASSNWSNLGSNGPNSTTLGPKLHYLSVYAGPDQCGSGVGHSGKAGAGHAYKGRYVPGPV